MWKIENRDPNRDRKGRGFVSRAGPVQGSVIRTEFIALAFVQAGTIKRGNRVRGVWQGEDLVCDCCGVVSHNRNQRHHASSLAQSSLSDRKSHKLPQAWSLVRNRFRGTMKTNCTLADVFLADGSNVDHKLFEEG